MASNSRLAGDLDAVEHLSAAVSCVGECDEAYIRVATVLDGWFWRVNTGLHTGRLAVWDEAIIVVEKVVAIIGPGCTATPPPHRLTATHLQAL